MTAAPARSARRALLPAVILLLALGTYAPAVNGGFVWTDHHFVEDNASLRTWASAPRMFITDAWQVGDDQRSIGYYRPIRNLTFLVDTQLFGTAPAGYHFTNVVIHALCSLLVFGVVRRTFGREGPDDAVPLAFWSAALFAVHPVHVEAVAWITGRTDSCAALGYLGALYAWLRAFDGHARWWWFPLGCVGAAWALLSKESAATLPAVLALCLWFRDRDGDRDIAPLLRRCAPAALLTVAYLVARGMVLSSVTNHPLWGGSVWTNGLTSVSLVGPYARLLVLGTPLLAVYEEHIRTALADPAVLAGLGIIVLTLGAISLHRRLPRLAFGAAWIALTLLPVMQIIPFKVLLAERFLYLPSVGWCVIVAAGLSALARRQRAAAATCGVIIVGAYALGAVRHVPAWNNDFALFTDSLEKAPHATEAVMALARAHLDAGQYPEARDWYVRATELAPQYYLAWYNRGLAHLNVGEQEEALAAFGEATRADPTQLKAWWPYGRAAYALDNLPVAVDAFATAAQRNPTVENFLWWGRALARSGRWEEAAERFRAGVARGANDLQFLAEAANAVAEAGASTEAATLFERARAGDVELAGRLMEETNQALAQGERGHAAYLARVSMRFAPDDLDAVNLYITATREEFPDAALAAVTAYKEAHPTELDAALVHASLLFALERPGAAAEAAAALVDAFPDAPEAHVVRAEERMRAGEPAQAAEAAQRAAALAPEDPRWWMRAGEYALEAHQYEEAIAALNRADRLLPNQPVILGHLARAYLAGGRSEDAAAVARRGLVIAPNDPTLLAVLDTVERGARR